MTENAKSKKITDLYPHYKVKVCPAGFLFIPAHGKVFPQEPLAVESTLLLDTDGSVVNGITPIDLSLRENAEHLQHIAADLTAANIDPKGKLRGVLFLRIVPDGEGGNIYCVCQPKLATCFALTVSWDKSREHIGNGASRNYARNHGALKISKHTPKSRKNGQDFWILPIEKLSDRTIECFEHDWLTRADRALDEQARRYPNDKSVEIIRRRLHNPAQSQNK